MTARDSLIAYGYALCSDGKYRRPNKLTQVWQELEDGKGWLRFDPDGMGNEVPEVYTINSNFAQTSGLSKVHHPGCFEWVYPEEEVLKIYSAAVEAKEAAAAAAVIRKGQATSEVFLASTPPTPEELAAMQNAQTGQADAVATPTKEKRHWWQKDG